MREPWCAQGTCLALEREFSALDKHSVLNVIYMSLNPCSNRAVGDLVTKFEH